MPWQLKLLAMVVVAVAVISDPEGSVRLVVDLLDHVGSGFMDALEPEGQVS